MNKTPSKRNLLTLAIGSIGVVYGDIGTSPLYAFRESIAAVSDHGPVAILGILSLILWSLTIIVTLKYVCILLRADNHGEGGILSLMTLVHQGIGKHAGWVMTFGIFGTALFYGDAIITPAISVLSAIEGVGLITHKLAPYTMQISIAILVGLFLIQRSGTGQISWLFGPITVIWFVALAWGGMLHIADHPTVWKAFNPYYAFHFIHQHGISSIFVLGGVFLAVTGAEALYADLGHFGKKPIRLAWLWFVMPSLMLNYLGQAALVLNNPETASNPFYLLYPEWALLPMVVLSTLATIFASQAVITGAYSLTKQAVQLGLLPRLHIDYTSDQHIGQIYMPQVNWALLAGVVFLILVFRSSSSLASAYGIAVTGTMLVTATFLYMVMRYIWKWKLPVILMVILPLISLDLVFLFSNLIKIFEGAFLPLLISAGLMVVMCTWRRGNHELHEQSHEYQYTMKYLLQELRNHPPKRVLGTAVYLSSDPVYAPSALLHNLKHNKVLHERNIIMTLRFTDSPYIDDANRMEIVPIDEDFMRIFMSFGYMEDPNVTRGMALLRAAGTKLDMMSTTFFISRRKILPSAKFGMPMWRDCIFISLSNRASDAANHFHLPPSRVVEMGAQIIL